MALSSDTMPTGVGQAIAADFCASSLSGEESPGSTGQGAR